MSIASPFHGLGSGKSGCAFSGRKYVRKKEIYRPELLSLAVNCALASNIAPGHIRASHDIDGVADHVGEVLLTFRASKHCSKSDLSSNSPCEI
jgi:hypothetical protein